MKVVCAVLLMLKTMADKAQLELESAQKALEDLLEEARRAGALPGWLRE
jgi:hypothetical protein